MRPIIPDYPAEALGSGEADTSGEPAGYIPELAAADLDRLGAAVATIEGEVYGAGDVDVEFTIQSISKPFAYALALSDRGFGPVLARVGVEPSGEAFNQISLESDTGRPLNPMINAGAITVHSLAGAEDPSPAERGERVLDGLSAFAGRPTRVHAIDDVARRMPLEVVRRLTLDGHEVHLVDPESVIPDLDPGDGGRVTAVDAVDQAVIPPRGAAQYSGPH
ncbi:glutaminase [Streptomyces sp. PT12]|uniref:glutaminase n=1 Tax=Streptomyces sp. PT12 TaxID=1510197 RepID=UPI000DE3BD2C|nr:glutaminase [Streptomyces sp. PT12]RBM10966.1 hypothetical protein DEH69_22480 [Streptomyces sp. PT12]